MGKYNVAKCKSCSAPMYPSFEKGGFVCGYCGNYDLWGSEMPEGESHFVPQHKSPATRDGVYDVSNFMRPAPYEEAFIPRSKEELKKRVQTKKENDDFMKKIEKDVKIIKLKWLFGLLKN